MAGDLHRRLLRPIDADMTPACNPHEVIFQRAGTPSRENVVGRARAHGAGHPKDSTENSFEGVEMERVPEMALSLSHHSRITISSLVGA
jgi:hypothetical protein